MRSERRIEQKLWCRFFTADQIVKNRRFWTKIQPAKFRISNVKIWLKSIKIHRKMYFTVETLWLYSSILYPMISLSRLYVPSGRRQVAMYSCCAQPNDSNEIHRPMKQYKATWLVHIFVRNYFEKSSISKELQG